MSDTDITLGEVSRKLDAFARDMRDGVSGIKADLRTKADREQFDRLEGRFDGLEARTEALEREKDLRDARADVHRTRDQRSWSWRQKAAAAVVTVLAVGASITDAIIRVIHG